MIAKIKGIRPLFNQLIVSKNAYTMEEAMQGGVYTGVANKLKEYQKVLAIGPAVKGIQVGDYVFINPARYAVIEHKQGGKDIEKNIIKDNMHATVNIPTYTIYEDDGRGNEISYQVMVIFDNDVSLCAVDIEEFNETPIIAPADGIIKPN